MHVFLKSFMYNYTLHTPSYTSLTVYTEWIEMSRMGMHGPHFENVDYTGNNGVRCPQNRTNVLNEGYSLISCDIGTFKYSNVCMFQPAPPCYIHHMFDMLCRMCAVIRHHVHMCTCVALCTRAHFIRINRLCIFMHAGCILIQACRHLRKCANAL